MKDGRPAAPQLTRLPCWTLVVAGWCGCAPSEAPRVAATLRLETSLTPSLQFNRVRVEIFEPAATAAFYDARWWVGTRALPALPVELVVFQGRASTARVVASAMLESFVVDRQEGVLTFDSGARLPLVLTLGPRFLCGNGLLDSGEGCDCGIADTQPNTCASPNDDAQPDSCRSDCVAAHCGDGVVDTGEQCDDQNGVDPDLCTNACLANVCNDGVPLAGVLCFAWTSSSVDSREGPTVGSIFAVETNGDGYPDLAGHDGNLRLSRNLGDGTFAAAVVNELTGLASYEMLPARLNDDPFTDFVFYNGQYGQVTAALADGSGGITRTVSPAWPTGQSQVTSYTWNWAVGRIDADELDDLFLTHKQAGRINVLLANGGGGWRYAPWIDLPTMLSDVQSVHLADVDADGDLDALVAFIVSGTLTGDVGLWEADGDGGFVYRGYLGLRPASVTFFEPLGLTTLHADAENLDLVVVTRQEVVLYLGDGAGAFTFRESVTLNEVSLGNTLIVTDFEANGRPDLFLPAALQTVEVTAAATLQLLPQPELFATAPSGSYTGAVADFDGDGLPDLVRPNPWCGLSGCVAPAFSVYLNRP